jgi:hypothetical protein
MFCCFPGLTHLCRFAVQVSHEHRALRPLAGLWSSDSHGMWLGYFEEFPDYLTQGEASPVPGHREINDFLAKHILKKLVS